MQFIFQEEGVEVEQSNGGKQSKSSSDGDATTGSYSSLEDEEADPINQLINLAARYQIDNVNLGNGNKICKLWKTWTCNYLQYKSSIVIK